MSDWCATKTGVELALRDLDIEISGGIGFMGNALVQVVKSGAITEARINDMITRVMTPYYLLGQNQCFLTLDLDLDALGNNRLTNRQVGAPGLLKNTDNVLPFNLTTDMNYFIYGTAGESDHGFGSSGWDGHAGASYQGEGSVYVEPTYGIDPLTSLMGKGRDGYLQIRYVITSQTDSSAINGSFNTRGFSDNAKCLVSIAPSLEKVMIKMIFVR